MVKVKYRLLGESGNERRSKSCEEKIDLFSDFKSIQKEVKGLGVRQMHTHLSVLNKMTHWDGYTHDVEDIGQINVYVSKYINEKVI